MCKGLPLNVHCEFFELAIVVDSFDDIAGVEMEGENAARRLTPC